MITTFLINLGLGIVELIIAIFPNSEGFSAQVLEDMQGLGDYIGLINAVYPLEPFFIMLGIVFATDGIIWTYRFIRSMSTHIPVVGGKGSS